MSILQTILEKISGNSEGAEQKKLEDYRERRRGRVARLQVHADVDISLPEVTPDEFADALNLRRNDERESN